MNSRQPKDGNDVSTSNAYMPAAKRKKYHRQYYVSRKENNKVSKVRTGDFSESSNHVSLVHDKSLERIPLRTLETNGSHMTQMLKENVPRASAQYRKEYNRQYYATRKENRKCITNVIQVTQTPIDDCTPINTLPSAVDVCLPEITRGFY
ncbi:hypothetical protein QVD17_08695 [Tagetes erecta]|uniref:Uncharacterized protein n=1 Tax=Tagetes erecta TaxID=13708 RepID=A0AAD8L623_TARER|nr:hypothetical protein QVD17_08695 [Tagetes erecta]